MVDAAKQLGLLAGVLFSVNETTTTPDTIKARTPRPTSTIATPKAG